MGEGINIFEIKNKTSIFLKPWNDLYLLLFFNLGIIIGNLLSIRINYLAIEVFIIGLLIIQLLNKRNRQIYKIIFNDQEKVLNICYVNFLNFNGNCCLSYDEIQYNYRNKIFGLRKIPLTLEIKERGYLVGEIKHKYNLGWEDNEIDEIHNRLKKLKNDEFKNKF